MYHGPAGTIIPYMYIHGMSCIYVYNDIPAPITNTLVLSQALCLLYSLWLNLLSSLFHNDTAFQCVSLPTKQQSETIRNKFEINNILTNRESFLVNRYKVIFHAMVHSVFPMCVYVGSTHGMLGTHALQTWSYGTILRAGWYQLAVSTARMITSLIYNITLLDMLPNMWGGQH